MLDVVASKLTSPSFSAKDVRVLWTEGTLYVVEQSGSVTTFSTPEPTKRGGYWATTVGEETLTFVRPGCGSCRARVMKSAAGQMSVEEIVAAAGASV